MTSFFVIRFFASLFAFLAVAKSLGSSLDSYNAYDQLEQALIKGNTSSIPNLHILADTFFPKRSLEPICVPVKYTLIYLYDNDTSHDACSSASNGTETEYSFLWTDRYLPYTTGALLLSYSQSGVTLRGFEWERSCLFASETEIVLELQSFNYSCDFLVSTLGDLSSQLKAYADADSIPKASSSYKGYALNWSSSEKQLNKYEIVFIVYITFLNIFIFCSSLASSNALYQKLYKNIKGKNNPGYSFFWALVILSVAWNVAPSWLVLSKYDNKVYASLAIVIPLQFVVAVLVRKRSDFPIPGLWYITKHAKQCTDDVHSIHRVVFRCTGCVLSHIVQVLSIWSLLVTFTFFMHYLTSVVVSLYLDPLNSLVKILFVKVVAVSFTISIALLFAMDVYTFKCSRSAMRNNVLSFLSIVTVLSLLPILSFFMFMIGGIIFNEDPQSGTWKSIFTLLPSALLLYGSWFSHGLLFPKGVTEKGNPVKEIEHDLEGDTPRSASPPADVASTRNSAHTQISMNEAPASTRNKQIPMNEATPLLAHPHDDDTSASVRSRVASMSTIMHSGDRKAEDV